MPVVTEAAQHANDMAIALKWYYSIYAKNEQNYGSYVAHIITDIATFEHKSPHDIAVIARGRLAAAKVIAAKGGPDVPGGGIVNTIGGTIAQGGHTVGEIVKAPLTVAEFLAKLADPFLWVRVTEVAGGAILIVIGVKMLSREVGVKIPFIPGG